MTVMATSMLRFPSPQTSKAVPRPASRQTHSMRLPYTGPPNYDTIRSLDGPLFRRSTHKPIFPPSARRSAANSSASATLAEIQMIMILYVVTVMKHGLREPKLRSDWLSHTSQWVRGLMAKRWLKCVLVISMDRSVEWYRWGVMITRP